MPFAVCWMIGVWTGIVSGHALLWWLPACGFFVIAAVMWRWRGRVAGWYWVYPAVITTAAAWAGVCHHQMSRSDIARFIGDEPQLVRVTGVIDRQPYLSTPHRGEFGHFSYKDPATLLTLKVESIVVTGQSQEAVGLLLVKIGQADHRIRLGDRVAMTGWLSRVRGPSNPGEFDYQKYLAGRGINGRLRLPTRGNWRLIDRAAGGSLSRVKKWLAGTAAQSLRLGIAFEPKRLAFLDAILLGNRKGQLHEIEEVFRGVGLSHLLSISGAHLGILLGLIWLLAVCVLPHPRHAAIVVLLALGVYVLAVPPRVPIVRAAVMASMFCTGVISARPARGLDLIALAAILVLAWRPIDLFSAGFQLSFGVVTGLVMFTSPVTQWLLPGEVNQSIEQRHHTSTWWQVGMKYLAVNIVAFLVALPLVAYHFQMVSPLAAIVSLAALPGVTVVLAVGYLKIVTGLLWPSVGMLLAQPLSRAADLFTAMTATADRLPWTPVSLTGQPSAVWVVATLAVITAWLCGLFARRRLAFFAAAGLCVIGLIDTRSVVVPVSRVVFGHTEPQLKLNMFSVGDGSCYLVRLTDTNDGSNEHVLMFDCGSQHYMDVGDKSIVPALRSLGIHRIDTLIISHADMDHFNGCLAVIDRVEVSRVLMPPQVLNTAKQKPHSATAFLIESLEQRGVDFQMINEGWLETIAGAQLEALWPPADYQSKHANDSSLVLSIRTGDRRVLLNGDVQQQSMETLLNSGVDLRADICELPHHGSFVGVSPRWLKTVSPRVVLQSSGPGRLRRDKWKNDLQGTGIERLISAHAGMAEITIGPNDDITWSSLKDGLRETD